MEPHPFQALVLDRKKPSPQAGRRVDQEPLLCALGLQGGCLQLLVCSGEWEAFLKLWFRSRQRAVPTTTLAVSHFPKGFANIKEQRGNKHRKYSKYKKKYRLQRKGLWNTKTCFQGSRFECSFIQWCVLMPECPNLWEQ